MALSSKLEALARMTDSFKTAVYDKHVGREAKFPWRHDHTTWLQNLYNLITSPVMKSQKRYSKYLMDTLSMLLTMCSLDDQGVRLAANETLNKIVKATYLTHITKIQMTAFNEMKKNGNSRSLRVALTLFAAISPHLQAVRCRPTLHSLAPVLINIIKRNEESLHECLRESWTNIFSTFGCHLLDKDIQALCDTLLSFLPSPSATSRRMASSGLSALAENGRRPLVYGVWIVTKVFNLLTTEVATDGTACLIGVLQTLRNILPVLCNHGDALSSSLPRNVYSFLLSCLLDSEDHNVVTSALEALQVLLQLVPTLQEFNYWLTTPSNQMALIQSCDHLLAMDTTVAPDGQPKVGSPNVKNMTPSHATGDSLSELGSIHDSYFGSSHESLELMEEEEDEVPNLLETTADSVTEGTSLLQSAEVDEQEMEDSVIIDEETSIFRKSPLVVAEEQGQPPASPSTAPKEDEFTTSVGSDFVQVGEEMLAATDPLKIVSWAVQLMLPINQAACFVIAGGEYSGESPSIGNEPFHTPIVHLAQLLGNCFHEDSGAGKQSVRVSVQSLSLTCLAHIVALYPGVLVCGGIPMTEGETTCLTVRGNEGAALEGSVATTFGKQLSHVLEAYSKASDPKLRGNASVIIGAYLKASLQLSMGDYDVFSSRWPGGELMVGSLVDLLLAMTGDESHLVIKAVCNTAKECLPQLFCSKYATSALKLFTALLQLKDSSYWLVKVELVDLLSSLDYAHIGCVESAATGRMGELQRQVLDTVFGLMGSDDQRVRDSAAEGLARMVPHLCPAVTKVGCLKHLAQQHILLQSHTPSTTPYTPERVEPASIGDILDRIMNIVVITTNQHQMLGCISALRFLAERYPPVQYTEAWNCSNEASLGWLSLMVPIMTSSWVTHHLQGHAELIDFLTKFVMGVAVKNVGEKPRKGQGLAFSALTSLRLAELVHHVFSHLLKLLNVFSHVIEGKEADQKLSKPMWEVPKTTSTPSKDSKTSRGLKLQEALKREIPVKLIGQFASYAHYLKLLEGVRSSYTNYQLNLDFEGMDKFSLFLGNALNCLAALLEVSTFQDIAKNTEEVMGYVVITFQVDPRGSLLCTQQLLNALFGFNAAMHRANIASPTVYPDSPPQSPHTGPSRPAHLSPSRAHPSSLYHMCVTEPVDSLTVSVTASMSQVAAEDMRMRLSSRGQPEETDGGELVRRTEPAAKLVFIRSPAKPANTVAQIQDYIKYFNQVVVVAMRQFMLTSSQLFQERVLFMLHQLLLLKVKFEPLDPQSNFLNAVLKHIDSLERGKRKGGERLVGYIFQLLILLAQDSTCKQVTLPKVIQLCDTVIASGHAAAQFILPALRPLVEHLFLRTPTSLYADAKLLNAAREMVIEKMLRMLAYEGTMNLFTSILVCEEKGDVKPRLARQILAALLPHLCKQQLNLDTAEAVHSLHELLMAIGAELPEIQPLFTTLASVKVLYSLQDLWRWAAGLSAILRMVAVVANDECLKLHVQELSWTPPTLDMKEITLKSQASQSDDQSVVFVHYLFQAIQLVAMTLVSAVSTPGHRDDGIHLLSFVLNDLVLLMEYFTGESLYPSLAKAGVSLVSELEELIPLFHCLATSWPLLPIHFFKLIASLKSSKLVELVTPSSEDANTANQELVVMVTRMLQIEHLISDPVALEAVLDLEIVLDCPGESPVCELSSQMLSSVPLCHLVMKKMADLNWSTLTHSHKKRVLGLLRVHHSSKEVVNQVVHFVLDKYMNEHTPSALVRMALSMVSLLMQDKTVVDGKLVADLRLSLEKLHLTKSDLYEKCSVVPDGPIGTESALLDPLGVQTGGKADEVSLEWLVAKAHQLCQDSGGKPGEAPNVVRLLLVLDEDSLKSILSSPDVNLLVLEHCVKFVVETARAPPPQRVGQFFEVPSTPPAASPFHRVLVLADALRKAFFETLAPWYSEKVNQSDNGRGLQSTVSCEVLASCALWFLAAPPTFPALSSEERKTLVLFGGKFLKDVSCSVSPSHHPHLALMLEYLGKILEDTFVISSLDEGDFLTWSVETIEGVYSTVESSLQGGVQLPAVLPSSLTQKAAADGSDNSPGYDKKISAAEKAASLLEAMHAGLLSPCEGTPPTTLPNDCFSYLHRVVIGVCRLPVSYPYCVGAPEAYRLGWDTPGNGFIPDHILVERDVLIQINRQIATLGWLTRQQFEECWMHYLRVLNHVQLPQEDSSPEGIESTLVLSSCIRGMMSLIVMATLTPECGNPLHSTHLHTHRHKDITFIGSRLGRKLSYLLKVLEDSQNTVHSLVETSISPASGLYDKSLERLCSAMEPGPGQLALVSLWPVMLIENVAPNPGLTGSQPDVDPRSSTMFLVEQFTTWLSNGPSLPAILQAEVLQAIVVISDVFSTSGQYEWMLGTFLEQIMSCCQEDVPSYAALVYGILKCTAVERTVAPVSEAVAKIIDEALSAESNVIQLACLQGLLYVLEDSNSSVAPLVSAALCRYLTKNLTPDAFNQVSQYHVTVMWAVVMAMIEHHLHHMKDGNDFANHVLRVAFGYLKQSSQLSDSVLTAFCEGMDILMLKCIVTNEDKQRLSNVAANRLQLCPLSQAPSYLRLLLVCMYSGEAGEAISGIKLDNEDLVNLYIREVITAILERFRKSTVSQAGMLVSVLPTVLVDFLTPTDAISTVIHEMLSPNQMHFKECAELLSKSFELLIALDQMPLITEWTLLSITSFTQRTPISLAIWSLLCLLLSSASSKELRAFLPVVASQYHTEIESSAVFSDILRKCVSHFYKHQCSSEEDKERFLHCFEGLAHQSVHRIIMRACQ